MSWQQQIKEAETLLAAYEEAELLITRLVADAVARGRLGTVDHYRKQQMELQRLLRRTKAVLDALESRASTEVFEEIQAEYAREYMQAIGAGSSPVVVPELAVQMLALETSTAVATANASILRSTADVYREITSKSILRALASGEDHQKSLQSALNQFANRGVTTLTDSAGRKWNMQSYADMAIRTGKSRARMEGRINGYTDAGVDLVLVSSHPACAPQCLPFQGRILSLNGPAGRREVTKPDGSTVTVDVVANIRDAIARGYHHPNCRHRETAYLPGMRVPHVSEQDPKEYEALQRQRQIERNIRRWKRRESVALTPEEAQYAKARVRVWQQAQSQHVAAWPGVLQRRYDREQNL